jgi:hypothetical protein
VSNSVRSLGSSRGVDAAIRPGLSRRADPGDTDLDFAAAISSAIGATAGAVATHGEGADPDGGGAGQSDRGGAQGPDALGQKGMATDFGRYAVPGAARQGAAPTMPGPTVTPHGIAVALVVDADTDVLPLASSADNGTDTVPIIPGTAPIPATDRTETPTGRFGVVTSAPSQVAGNLIATLDHAPFLPSMPAGPGGTETRKIAGAVPVISPRGLRHGTPDFSASTVSPIVLSSDAMPSPNDLAAPSPPGETIVPAVGVTTGTRDSVSSLAWPQREVASPTAANNDPIAPSLSRLAKATVPGNAAGGITPTSATTGWPRHETQGSATPSGDPAAPSVPPQAAAIIPIGDAVTVLPNIAPADALAAPSLVPPDATVVPLGDGPIAPANAVPPADPPRPAAPTLNAPTAPVAFDRFGWRIRLNDDGAFPAARGDNQADLTSPSTAAPLAPKPDAWLGTVAHSARDGISVASAPPVPDNALADLADTLRSVPVSVPAAPTDGLPGAPIPTETPIEGQTAIPPQDQTQTQNQTQSVAPTQVAPPLQAQPQNGPQDQPQPLVSAVIVGAGPFNNADQAAAPKAPLANVIDATAGTPPLSPSGAAPATVAGPTGGDTSAFGAPTGFGDTIATHVMSMISSGRQEATMQLQPPQLGELTVRVSVQGRDVSTWFGAAQPQVQVAVSQALEQLRTNLAGAGLSLAGAWVGADTSTMQQRMFDSDATSARRPGFAVPSAGGAAVDTIDPSHPSSGVSIYV